MSKPSILVIDDDPACLKMISAKALDGAKYKVFTASSRIEGLNLAALHRPDCILVDYHLQDGSAVDVCGAIRADDNLKKTPIIVISADPTRNIEAQEDCQADRFIAKCVPLAEYDAAIQSLLRRVAWERGILEKGDLRIEAATGMVSRYGKPVARLSDERFQLLALLVGRSPEFVPEKEIVQTVLHAEPFANKKGAVKTLVCRLRHDLGTQIGRRLKNKRNQGWIYVQPRLRSASDLKTGRAMVPN